jgi:Transglycosylase-like domain
MRKLPRFAKSVLRFVISIGAISVLYPIPAVLAAHRPARHLHRSVHHAPRPAHHVLRTVHDGLRAVHHGDHAARPKAKDPKKAVLRRVHKPRPIAHVRVAKPAGGVWQALRGCESSGNYRADTGNGFYGAYQFTLATWQWIGGAGRPDQASDAVQDAMAARLQARSGWGNWPACSVRLGLS